MNQTEAKKTAEVKFLIILTCVACFLSMTYFLLPIAIIIIFVQRKYLKDNEVYFQDRITLLENQVRELDTEAKRNEIENLKARLSKLGLSINDADHALSEKAERV